MIFFRNHHRSFFSLASFVELFFIHFGKIFIFFISILISGYCLIFYEFGGDFFLDHKILGKPFYVFKYIWKYIVILFKHRKSLEISIYIKFFFFLILPYIIYKILYNSLQFILFFLHKKTQKRMPILSSFLLRFVKETEKEKQDFLNKQKNEMKGPSLFSQLFSKKNENLEEQDESEEEKQKKTINLRK